MKKIIAIIGLTVAALFAVSACTTEADTVNENLSKDAEGFKIQRRIVFINGITDKYILSVEGRCSIETPDNQIDVLCKTGPGEYKRHSLGLSDNVTWFSEQLESAKIDPNHYKVVFRPQTIVPDVDYQSSADADRDDGEIPEGSGDPSAEPTK